MLLGGGSGGGRKVPKKSPRVNQRQSVVKKMGGVAREEDHTGPCAKDIAQDCHAMWRLRSVKGWGACWLRI
jgi:hypothetical protein